MGSLFDYYRQRPPAPFMHRLNFCIDIATGMNYLHSCDPPLLHRDLKSLNILLAADAQGHVHGKITDFGLAVARHGDRYQKAAAAAAKAAESGETARKKGGTFTLGVTAPKGTFLWMSPELHRGARPTPAVDVFAFGVILTELLSWRGPYMVPIQDLNQEQLYQDLMDRRQLPPLYFDRRVAPPQLQDLVRRCLAMDPYARPAFSDMVDFLHSIEDEAGRIPGLAIQLLTAADVMAPPRVVQQMPVMPMPPHPGMPMMVEPPQQPMYLHQQPKPVLPHDQPLHVPQPDRNSRASSQPPQPAYISNSPAIASGGSLVPSLLLSNDVNLTPLAHALPPVVEYQGTINPSDIKILGCVTANLNCTVEKGFHQGLAVIVKRSVNKRQIQREIAFLERASKSEFVVAFVGWFEEVGLNIMRMVMQKCAMDLKDWAHAASRTPPPNLDELMVKISEDICKGLVSIHNLGIIHNDLKPQNVFMDKYSKPYIGDFGVATNRGEPGQGYTEQYFDKESLDVIPDELSDSWLLGATLWEFWSDEPFNVNEKVHLDDIRNRDIQDPAMKSQSRSAESRSAASILRLRYKQTPRPSNALLRIN
ncbi:hypothetical protein HDU96_010944 [Phlyctochytrium bullatum]|nr:hypothetical protein HDU96_010944 [Phlyctochytrium bullatum]